MGKFTFSYPRDHSKKKPIHKEAIKSIKKEDSDALDLSTVCLMQAGASTSGIDGTRCSSELVNVRSKEYLHVNVFNIKDGNSDKNILLTLSRINFYNLGHLDLGECQIENIENLPTGPNLNYLSLINNNIYSIQALKKFSLPRLKTLLLNDNPIKELGVERKYNFKTIKECLGQTCLFKLKKNEIKDISIESLRRIHQPNYIRKIHDAFPDVRTLFFIEPEDLFDSDSQFVIYLSDEEEEGEEDDAPMQVMEINDTEIHQPPALYFVEGEQEQTWVEEVKLIEGGKKIVEKSQDQTEDINRGDEQSEQADDEQESNQVSGEKSFCSSTSRWDSGLEEDDEKEENEDDEKDEKDEYEEGQNDGLQDQDI